MDERPCAHCRAPFRVNPRARKQEFCGLVECQRERRRLAQKKRRAEKGVPPLSSASRTKRADYMQGYRRSHEGYRRREREAAARRRAKSPAERVVTEAGLADQPAMVYVLPGPGGSIRLRVATDAGWSATFDVAEASVDQAAAS